MNNMKSIEHMKLTAVAAWLLGAMLASGQFYIEASPWARGGMEMTVEGGSSAAQDGVWAAPPGTQGPMAWTAPSPAGYDDTTQTLRTFDDGYVGPSGWQWASDLGISQYFSYETAGQYNSTANTLTFAETTYTENVQQHTTTSVESGPVGWDGKADIEGIGALITMGYTFAEGRRFDFSMQFQAGWLEGMDAAFRDQTAWSQRVTWSTIESRMEQSQQWNYTYDTLGNPFFPSAPYEMTDPAGVGPMISDSPMAIEEGERKNTSTDRVVKRKQAMAFSRVDLDVEMAAFMLALGPRLRFHPTERLSILAQGGVTLNLLDANLTRTETFAWEDGRAIQIWTDQADEQKWLLGGTLSAGLQFDMTKEFYLQASAGYDWVENCDLSIGADRIRIDLDGYRANVALGWRFGR